MIMMRFCDVCLVEYSTQRRTSRYCSERCKKRAQRGGLSAPQRIRVAALPSDVPSALVEAVTAELEHVGRLDSVWGVMALSLARALSSSSYVSGAGVAALSKQLTAVMDVATRDTLVGSDPLDEVQRRRDRKRLSGQ
jgi:hypothetical protein